jgi:formate-dependent nitrite reductase membrane component NrfD
MQPPEAPAEAPIQAANAPPYRWYHKTAGLIAVILLFELGIFLLIWPWTDDWDLSFLPYALRQIWNSNYFRGAVSGLGVLNIYLFFVEVFRLRRFSRPS